MAIKAVPGELASDIKGNKIQFAVSFQPYDATATPICSPTTGVTAGGAASWHLKVPANALSLNASTGMTFGSSAFTSCSSAPHEG